MEQLVRGHRGAPLGHRRARHHEARELPGGRGALGAVREERGAGGGEDVEGPAQVGEAVPLLCVGQSGCGRAGVRSDDE